MSFKKSLLSLAGVVSLFLASSGNSYCQTARPENEEELRRVNEALIKRGEEKYCIFEGRENYSTLSVRPDITAPLALWIYCLLNKHERRRK